MTLTRKSHGIVLAALLCTGAIAPVMPRPASASSQPDTQTVTLLASADVHGRLTNADDPAAPRQAYGLARLSTLVKRIRQENPYTVYVDAGDLLQGTPMSDLAARRPDGVHPMFQALDEMGCVAMALGNHDFDFGQELLRRVKRAPEAPGFTPLAANCVGPDGQPAFAPYKVIQVGALRVGILGLTTQATPYWETPSNTEGLKFEDPVAAAAKWVGVLRGKERADLVIAVVHSGLEREPQSGAPVHGQLQWENRGWALANAGLGLDAIVLAHTHQRIWGIRLGSSLMVQPGKWADRLSRVDFRMYRTPAGVWKILAARPNYVVAADSIPEDPAILAIAKPHEDAAREWMDRVVADAADRLDAPNPGLKPDILSSLVNQAQREAAHADVSLTTLYTPNLKIPAGPITERHLYQWYSYENTVVGVRCTARTLKAALEQSASNFCTYVYRSADSGLVRPSGSINTIDVADGVDYRVNLERPDGSRVMGLSLNGKLLQPDDSITVALNAYRASGAGGYPMMGGLPVVYRSTQTVRELLEAKLRAMGTVRNAPAQNWAVYPEYITDPERETFDMLVRGGDALVTPGGKLLLRGSPTQRATTREALLETARRRYTDIVLLETTDFHGSFMGAGKERSSNKNIGGAAALAGYIRRERAKYPGRTLLLDGGDAMQGSAISNLTFGRSIIAMMRAMGHDAMTVGNHEFDWTIDTLVARMRDANFPILAANIREKSTGKRPAWARPYALLKKNGITVGVIGLITQSTPSTTFPTNVAHLDFPDPVAAANELVPEMRAKGAEVVVVLDHEGAELDRDNRPSGAILDIARGLRGVDVVFGGHTHNYINTRVNGRPVIVSASNGRALGEVRVIFDRKTRTVADTRQSLFTVYTDSIAPDSAVAALVEHFNKDVGPLMSRVLGTADVELSRGGSEPRMGNLVVDVMRQAVKAQVGFQNSGGVRADIPAGPITMGQVYDLMPFDNTVVELKMTGRELKAVLEEWFGRSRGPVLSGVQVSVNRDKPVGQRVVGVTFDGGAPLDSSAVYSVATNDFLAAGGDGLSAFKNAQGVTNTGILMRDAIANWIEAETKAGRVIHPPAGSRVTELR